MVQETIDVLEREETEAAGHDEPESQVEAQESEEDEMETLRGALRQAEERIATLEQEASSLREALERREGELGEARSRLEAAEGQIAVALERYRASLLAAAPEVPEELVSGETVEALEASFRGASEMVERVRARLAAQMGRQRVPPGAPTRSSPDVSGLSPREKIAHALTRR